MASTNIFNINETSFMFGIGSTEHVVMPASDPASWFKSQPRTRELATVIECIGSAGQVLPPLVITKGHIHTIREQWQMAGILALWHFSKTDNGWTNNELTIQWLEAIFDPETKPLTPLDYHLLIIDGHRLHTSQVFCSAAWSQQIIPFLLPAHATHVMQPLDVSIFGPLTGNYRHLVNEAAKHVNSIDKTQFGTVRDVCLTSE